MGIICLIGLIVLGIVASTAIGPMVVGLGFVLCRRGKL